MCRGAPILPTQEVLRELVHTLLAYANREGFAIDTIVFQEMAGLIGERINGPTNTVDVFFSNEVYGTKKTTTKKCICPIEGPDGLLAKGCVCGGK